MSDESYHRVLINVSWIEYYGQETETFWQKLQAHLGELGYSTLPVFFTGTLEEPFCEVAHEVVDEAIQHWLESEIP